MNRDEKRRRIYAKVPRVNCKGLCQECCGPIGMTPMEKLRLDRAAGHEVRAENSVCSALVDGQCSAYEERPLICRLWGATERMPCHFGCEVIDNGGKPLSDGQAFMLVRDMESIGGGESVWTIDENELVAILNDPGGTA